MTNQKPPAAILAAFAITIVIVFGVVAAMDTHDKNMAASFEMPAEPASKGGVL